MLRTDLKIFKSERMTQQADAGGQRTSNEVQNGQLNEVFGNISDIDHAQSAVDIAKIYPAVSTADTALLQDGHILINEPPLDPLVDVMIIEAAAVNDGSTRADIIEAIESSLVPSLALRTGLSEMVAGQDQIAALDLTQAAAFSGEQPTVTLRLGGIYVISVEYTGLEDAAWPRFTHFIKVTAIEPDFVRFEPPLPHPAPGRGRLVNTQSRCTVLRDTTAGAGVMYHGVTQLTANSAGTTLNVARTSGRVTPNITEAVERANNAPFLQELGLTAKEIAIPAVGVSYTVAISDHAQLVSVVNYFNISYLYQGRLRKISKRPEDLVNNSLSFVLPNMPDAGTDVIVSYYSSDKYSSYNNAGPLPAGFSLLLQTIQGSVQRISDGKTFSVRVDDNDYTRLLVWINTENQNMTLQVAVVNPVDGTATMYNGFDNLQYNAVLLSDSASGEAATAAQFAIPFDETLPATFYMAAELTAGGLVSASGDANGDITGTGVSGTINGSVVNLSFTQAVKLSTLRYAINEVVQLVPPQSLYGINQLRLPNGGKVNIFRPFGVVCVANNEYQQFASLTAAQTIARRPNSFIDIVDSTGSSLWHPLNSYFEYDKATGEVTIVDASAFTAPFELVDTLSELALVTGVTDNTLKITAPLQGSFPAGSIVSSVYQLGDLQARVTNLFDQVTWNTTWQDTIQGDPATANYNSINYPIELINADAINERWAIIFTSDTAFRCVGQLVGQVGTGDTLNDFAPINPATGQPYFVIRSAGWGGSWLPGNVLRFNTVAASKPAVLLRSVSAGHSAIDQDSIRLHFRGNAQ